MKTILPLIMGFAAFSAIAQNQNGLPSPDPFPPPAPEPPGADPLAVPVPPAQAAKPARPSQRVKRVEIRPAGVPGVMAQAATPAAEGGGGGRGGQVGAVTLSSRNLRSVDADNFLPRSAKTGRTLVIQTSDPDATALANAEEDLSVMALILRKATGNAGGDERRMVAGIEVFGSSSGARNIYLEGYGALFLLGVRFPLVAPPDKAEETKVKDTTSSDWADAREEYLNAERSNFDVQFDRVWQSVNRQPAEDYEADKVEELTTSLLDSLKNATHIRSLKPADYVTVVIQGAEAVRPEKKSSRAKGSTSSRRSDSDRNETVMTVRAKKSDVDAFAKGNLDLAGFRKKAAVHTYLRRADSSVATSLFLSPPAR
jgi:hypothetical protein